MHTVLQSCKSKKQPLDQSGLQLLIDEYIYRWGDSYKLEDEWWGDKKLTWEEAMARAWKSRLSHGKMGVAELRDDGSRHRNILKLEVVN